MKKRFISVILILLLILVIIFIISLAIAGRSIGNIESKFERDKVNFEYCTNILINDNNNFAYIHIFSEFEGGLYVEYSYANDYFNIKKENFDYFFDKILPCDKNRIYDFIRRNGIRQIIYSESNIEFVMWSAGSRARGIMYNNNKLNEVDEEFLYLNNIYKKYYSFEKN